MKNFIIAVLIIGLIGMLYLYTKQVTFVPGIVAIPQTVQKKANLVLVSSNIAARKYGEMYTLVVGEIKNNSDTAVSYIPVTIILRDQNGKIVDTGSTNVEPSVLQPGMSGGFSRYLIDKLDSGIKYDIVIGK